MVRIFCLPGVLLIALVLNCTQVSARDHHFKGRFICPKNWIQYQIFVNEFDWKLSPDGMYTGVVLDSVRPHRYDIKFYWKSGDQADDAAWNHEIYFHIWHTCTDDGKWMIHENRVGYFDFYYRRPIDHTHHVELTNGHHVVTDADWADYEEYRYKETPQIKS